MYKTIEKVLIEYVFTMLKGNAKVKGRVCERLGGDATVKYSWAVSHYYRLAENAPTPHKPGKTECANREEADRLLYAYIRAYTGVGVEANPDY
jgi:hypothetical protein